MALNFKSLLTRTLTAAVFVAVLLSAIHYNYISFTVLFFIVSIWGLWEFYKIAEKLGAKPFRISGIISAIVLYASSVCGNQSCVVSWAEKLVPVFIFLIFVLAIFSKEEKPLHDVFYTIIGLVYSVLPFVLLNKLACLPLSDFNSPLMPFREDNSCYYNLVVYNYGTVLGMILLIWASDSFAYLVGSMIGKRKLYEKISPGKTWEGTIGGGVLTMASSYIVAGWFPEIQFVHWLVISVLVVVFGTLGDLFESLLKRQAGIKDSGKIMPGHGGILDRFDSLIFVTPFVYLYLSWVLS